jgi:hypothetical protein
VWRPGDAAPIDVLHGRGLGANAQGVVVGMEIDVGAFRLDPGTTTPVRLSGGTAAEDINDAGLIVGYHFTGTIPTGKASARIW